MNGRNGKTFLLLPIFLLLSGCLTEEGDLVQEDGTQVDVVAPIAQDPGSLVCNPFGSGAEAGERAQGVLATLFYLDDNQPHYRTAAEYVEKGTKVDELNLYFNQIYVPTRPFDRGFVTQAGNTIETAAGDTLYEYFGVEFEGRIKLGPADKPGKYQFAVLSDDGSVLYLDQDGNGLNTHINNDGDHATKMGCATEAVDMAAGSEMPFKLQYYQGPRYHISVVLLWREWTGDPADVECGKGGVGRYFNSNNDPITPTSNYTNLLARGWKVLDDSNFLLPVSEGENPCNEIAPNIIEYGVADVGATFIAIRWITDIPATSKVSWTNVATGESGETALNLSLVTDRTVTVDGLSPNTVYKLKVISASNSGSAVESPEISIRTSR